MIIFLYIYVSAVWGFLIGAIMSRFIMRRRYRLALNGYRDGVLAAFSKLTDDLEAIELPVEIVGDYQPGDWELELLRRGCRSGWCSALRAIRSAVTPDLEVPDYIDTEQPDK